MTIPQPLIGRVQLGRRPRTWRVFGQVPPAVEARNEALHRTTQLAWEVRTKYPAVADLLDDVEVVSQALVALDALRAVLPPQNSRQNGLARRFRRRVEELYAVLVRARFGQYVPPVVRPKPVQPRPKKVRKVRPEPEPPPKPTPLENAQRAMKAVKKLRVRPPREPDPVGQVLVTYIRLGRRS